MKKLFISIILCAAVSTLAFAQDRNSTESPFNFHLNFTNFGIGTHVPYPSNYNIEFSIELLSIGVEHKETNIALTFSPFKIFMWGGVIIDDGYSTDDPGDATSIVLISLINMYASWNVLSFLDTDFHFSPFVSVNYLFLGEKFYMEKYILGAGFLGGVRGGDSVKFNIFTVEAGFRLINNQPLFYAGIKFDFIMYLLRQGGVF